MYRILEQAVPFTDIDKWRWPRGDKKLAQVFDHVSDIETIMRFVSGNSVCVQAGGACGVWPLRFAQSFDKVYTFEPQKDNFKCLQFNCEGADNIEAFNAPLSDDEETYVIHNDIHERENWGAGYLVPSDKGIKAVSIDSLELEACDLIQLDVEGFELNALRGAYETIGEFNPTIVVEQKRLNHRSGDGTEAKRWLELTFGYSQVAKAHNDVILTHG